MWFRNLQLYRLNQPFDLDPERLHEQLEHDAFHGCPSLEMSAMGWDRPLGNQGKMLTHGANGYIMVCARKEQKVLPAAVVREVLDDRVETIEAEQGRRVGRKERQDLRDEIMQDLLPKAFTRSSRNYAYIAPKDGWVVVDAPSANRAEEVLSLLRTSIGSLPVAPLSVALAPPMVMTGWMKGQSVPEGFVLGEECELRDTSEDGGVVRCRRQDLASGEMQAHLDAGKQVTRLALEWNERLSFVLGEDLGVRRLRFLDLVQEEAEQVEAEDAGARFDADFALMTLELGRFLPQLVEVFGGEQVAAQAA